MDPKHVISIIMKKQKVKQRDLGEKLGYRSSGAVSAILSRKGMSVELLVKTLEVLGCTLVVRDKDGAEYVLDSQPDLDWFLR